jgi:hypothetical protein
MCRKKAQLPTGKRGPKAVDMEISTRFDNISDNIFANLQCMMDTFHIFDLSTVFFHYIRYDDKDNSTHFRTNKFHNTVASTRCPPPIFKRALCSRLWTGR